MAKEKRKATVISAPAPIHVRKYRPNDKCPCGSGKKVKNCGCGQADPEYYYLRKKGEQQ